MFTSNAYGRVAARLAGIRRVIANENCAFEGQTRLRLAVDNALGANMGKDTIERAIKRGAGELDGADYSEIRYEGYGPGGTAVMVDCLTDNKNRTVAEVRHAFSKHGGNLGADGSVNYLFNHVGELLYPAGSDEDAVMEAAIAALEGESVESVTIVSEAS